MDRRAVRELRTARRRAERRAAALATALIVGLALVLYGAPVPRLSEELYLPLARHVGDPAYLAGDWTMRGSFGEHWVFNHVFGPIAARVPLVWFGWIGRMATWTAMAVLLVRLGGRIGLTPLRAAAAVALWLLANQALIGGDWMFGTFEAKTIADLLVLGALLAATSERVPLAIALFGLAISFHPGLGGWSAFAGGAALLANPTTRRGALRWAPLGLVLAAPGIIGVLSSVGASTGDSKFLVTTAIPYHLDPFFGGATRPELQVLIRAGTLCAMLAANVVWFRRSDRGPAQQFLIAFQLTAIVPVGVAFVARPLEAWQFLTLQPLRVAPLVIPLIFFFQLVRRVGELAARERKGIAWWRRRSVVLGGLGLVVALCVTSPVLAAPRMTVRTAQAWFDDDPEAAAFRWLAANTPTTTRCVVPADRQDAFVRAERPIVANWQAIRYDALPEWRRRIDALVGGRDRFEEGFADLTQVRADYDALTEEQMTAIARRYRANCVVATTEYSYPVLHKEGPVRIYRIGATPAP